MQPMLTPLVNQFIACASRSPAEAGNRFIGRAGYGARRFGRSVRKTNTDRWSSAKSLRCGGAFSDGWHWNSAGSVAVRRPAAAASTNEVRVRPVFEKVSSSLPRFYFRRLGLLPFFAGRALFWVGSSCGPSPALPNHSLKLSANGVSRWPCGARASPHFAPPGQRATPLSPA